MRQDGPRSAGCGITGDDTMLFKTITLIQMERPLRERAFARKRVGPYYMTPRAAGGYCGFYSGDDGQPAAHGSAFALRMVDANDCLESYDRLRNITGYYCDPDGDGDTLQPVVFRLPRGRGFLPGWTMGPSMCGCVDRDVLLDDAADAAMAAHDMAERHADDARERSEGQEEDQLCYA